MEGYGLQVETWNFSEGWVWKGAYGWCRSGVRRTADRKVAQVKKGFFDFISSAGFVDNPRPSAEPRNSLNQQDVPWPPIHYNNVLESGANENDDLSSETDANYVPESEEDENQPCNSQAFVLKKKKCE
ncbi:unnamed protein product [Parnassius apollo]|uniref:(apollo) hypothetical protein n=1 Tax=Parnassius apollo TaxID=110799 RepID=A0A8S3WMM8_PARAO|nr:unnamed protein product [Parnassius apollo]